MKEQARKLAWAAWLFWLLIFLFICGDVLRRPLKHTTTPTYRLASLQWWAGQDPYSYNNHAGFLYLPQAAILFTPFTWGSPIAGQILWRAVVFGLFAYAIVRLQRFFLEPRKGFPAGKTFLLLSLLAVPCSMASLRNAQFDLPLAALGILGAAEIAAERWNWAAFWLCLAVALKPLALVPMLLFGALYWRLLPRLLIGGIILALLPFLHWNPAFVAHEYVRCAQTLIWATGAHEPRYSDLAALLSRVGIYPPDGLKTAARLLFALIFLGLGLAGVLRLNRSQAAWNIGALSATYLMLFNPRTETCSYIFLGPFTASLALWMWKRESRWLGWALALASLGFACDAVPHLNGWTDRWLKPLLATLFLPTLLFFIRHPGDTSAEGSIEPAASGASSGVNR